MMTIHRRFSHNLWQSIACILILCMGVSAADASGRSQGLEKYSAASPLVIVTDSDFPPFTFRNEDGNPDGYNIEVVTMVLKKLDIPYVIYQQDWTNTRRMFMDGNGDLIILKNKSINGDSVFYSKSILVSLFQVVAHKKGDVALQDMSKLKPTDIVGFKESDYAATEALKQGIKASNMDFCSPRHGLHHIESGSMRYYIYGKESLKWYINEQHLKDIELSPINFPAGAFRFVSHDKQLLDAIDDQFARLEQSGEIKKLKNKWFNPSAYGHDASPVVLYLILATIVIAATMLFLNKVIVRRIRRSNSQTNEYNTLMNRALTNSDHHVICYDLDKGILTNIYGKLLPEAGIAYTDYINRIHPDNRQEFQEQLNLLLQQRQNTKENTYRWNVGTPEEPEWRYLTVQSIVENNSKGKPAYTINTILDITEERKREETNERLTERFSKVFEKTFVGLSMYDVQGRLLTVNPAMREIFHFENPDDEFYFNINLYDLPFLKDVVQRDNPTTLHFCTHIHIPERNMHDYLEIKMKPIRNEENGKIETIVLTARNLSQDYAIYQQTRENDAQLRRINLKVKEYENNLRYLLKENDIRVWRSSLQNQEVAYFKNLHTLEIKVSFKEFMDKVQQDIDPEAYKKVFTQDNMSKIYKSVIPIKNLFEQDDKTHWYVINSMSEHNAQGNVIGYFGMIRDITPLIDKQEKLKKETLRAQESVRQKSVFLANMTHEIRTPLNAIVGFCDLLQAIDEEEDKKEFTRIIRKNCNLLLQLINDILDISAIDSNGQLVHPRQTDFATDFEDMCISLKQRVDNPNVIFLKENPYSTLPAIVDSARIQQVITNFVTNAVKYTQQGYIKVGYNIMKNGLYIYCEDTGCGIPKDKCDSIFERFVKLNDFIQGTGLGLSICKTISEQCGGDIGVESEEGKGSTFWIWIPYK